jgi:hypothetical protein
VKISSGPAKVTTKGSPDDDPTNGFQLFASGSDAILIANLIFLRLSVAETSVSNLFNSVPDLLPAKLFPMQIPVTTKTLGRTACWIVLLLAFFTSHAAAQSTDVAWPSPVRTSEVAGRIAARDLGDPRVTDHFYAFTGTPGDLLINVDSRNFNGDIDVFTFSGLRPLLKFTVYAGNSAPITKSIYLRQQEDLILRVEGRTPNDDEAVYQIRFSGSFAPITSGPLAEHEDAMHSAIAVEASAGGGRRVSSVGARIEEPPTEVAETPTPEPTPVETPEPKPVPARPTSRNSRTRRPPSRRTRTNEPAKPAEAEAKAETEEKTAETAKTETKPPVTGRRRPARRSPTPRVAKLPATPEPEPTGPRLIIETNDGTFVDRYMNSVRRVTVENGQVVVVGKDGKVQRISLASVVRMTITP